MNVYVIGCGPAGVLAAYAALLEGCDVTVVAPKIEMSPIHGAQYIHGLIPGLPPGIEPFEISYTHIGTEEVYRRKIYGDAVPVHGTSWGRFRPREWAWSTGEVYRHLFDVVRKQCEMRTKVVDERVALAMVEDSDYVLNTAPLKAIKPEGEYRHETVFIVRRGIESVQENQIIYFGDYRHAYRTSNIKGVKSTEYPSLLSVPFVWRRGGMATRVVKPLDCVVELPGVCRLGRYGKWQKGVLAHHAYEEARQVIGKRLSWTATLPV